MLGKRISDLIHQSLTTEFIEQPLAGVAGLLGSTKEEAKGLAKHNEFLLNPHEAFAKSTCRCI